MQLNRPSVENVRLYAVIVRKATIEMEFLAFAPGGRPAVFWTRALAEGFLRDLLRQKNAAAGHVELWKVSH